MSETPKLQFLGRGSAFHVSEGSTAAYYVDKNELLLIDCGESTFSTLLKKKILDSITKVSIAITHLHPDHAGSLGSLLFYCYYIKKISPILWESPSEKFNTRLCTFLELVGVESQMYSLSSEISAGNLHLKMGIPLQHVPNLLSFGFLLNNGNSNCFYSGDTKDIEIVLEQIKKDTTTIAYIDCCLADYEGNNHMPFRILAEKVPENLRNKIYCMHIDNNEVISKAKAFGFHVVEKI